MGNSDPPKREYPRSRSVTVAREMSSDRPRLAGENGRIHPTNTGRIGTARLSCQISAVFPLELDGTKF